jgi:transposase-like protein
VRHKSKKVSYTENMKKRNKYSAEFKSKVVLEVLQETSTINEIGAKYGISPVVIGRWKTEFIERSAEIFKKGPSAAEKELQEKNERVAQLERKVGQLTYEVDWLKKKSEEIVGPDWKKRFR